MSIRARWLPRGPQLSALRFPADQVASIVETYMVGIKVPLAIAIGGGRRWVGNMAVYHQRLELECW